MENLAKASTEESSSSVSDNALTNKAYLFMKKMLPSYIVNCFMATGYDSLDVLADIIYMMNPPEPVTTTDIGSDVAM